MPFKTNCPKCGKEMLLLKSMYGKPKRCSHCDMLFRVGGGPLPTEAELAAFEAQQTNAPAPRPRPAAVRAGSSEPIADVIPVDDPPARAAEPIADVIAVDDRPPRYSPEPLPATKGRIPAWLLLTSIGLVLVGMGVAGFFIWKAVSERDKSVEKKKDDPKDDDDSKDKGKAFVTRDALKRLRFGMPQGEALAILGTPTQIDDSQKPKRPFNQPAAPEHTYLRRYFWRNGGDVIEVHFLFNQVQFYKGNAEGLEMANGVVIRDDRAKLTVEKYRQLTLNMSEQAATNLLGKWQSRSSSSRFDPMTKQQVPFVTLTWTEGTSHIQMRFVNDQLVGGNGTINGITQPPIGK
jgi:hypothetical protein